jgi:hypothetical protein
MFSFIIIIIIIIILHLTTRTPLSTKPSPGHHRPTLLHHDPPRNLALTANQTHRKTHKSQPTTDDPTPKKQATHRESLHQQIHNNPTHHKPPYQQIHNHQHQQYPINNPNPSNPAIPHAQTSSFTFAE